MQQSAKNRFWDRSVVRYMIAVVAVGVAFLLRQELSVFFGSGLAYITFYPAVMLVATLGGFGPGLLATAMAALIAAIWILPPQGRLGLINTPDVVGLVIFSIMGVFMSIVAGLYHRARQRVTIYEKEMALNESQQQYRELVQNANSAIIRWKRNGTITFFNEYAQQFFGFSEKEVLGKSILILLPKTDSTGVDLTTLAEKIVSHPERYVNYTNENVLRDGTRVWMTWTNKPIFDENGQVEEILAVGNDITERKRAGEALIESEQQYRTLFETMTEGFALCEIILDEQGKPCDWRYLELNPAFERNTGLTVDDVAGKTVREVLPNIESYWIENYGRVALTGQPTRFENYLQELNKYFEVFAFSPARGQFAVLFVDITDRKRAEQDLADQSARLQEQAQLLDLAHVLIRDPEDHIVMWNSGDEEFYGFSKEEAIGRFSHELLQTSFPVSKEAVDKVLETTGHWQGELVHTTKDGRKVVVASHQVLQRDDESAPIAIIEVNNDITEQRRAQQEREITVEFLRIVNKSTGTLELIQGAITFFQKQSGCQAIGLRLRDGDDYPYYEARGFPEEFVVAENSLCTRDAVGDIIRDSSGYPVLECMCGNVIFGRFDPSKPFFTTHGSFWTNCTTELLASTSEADRQARTRNRCNGEGYESVALIPLSLGEERLGLLQMNDRRKGVFTDESISLWERLAGYLAVALAKCHAEEDLQESEERFRVMADAIPQLAWMAGPDGYIFWYNQRWYDYTGTTPEQMKGWGWQRVHDPEMLPKVLAQWTKSIATGEPFDMEFPMRGADGWFRWFLTRVMPMKDSEGRVTRWFGTNTDISEKREIETHKQEFYKRTIRAATGGKLLIAEKEEIEAIAGPALAAVSIKTVDDLAKARQVAMQAAESVGMKRNKVHGLISSVGEATSNAYKHAGGGMMSMHRTDDALLFMMTDNGSGIDVLNLPDVALTMGYSTAGTGGMGYKMIIGSADKVYLSTGPKGTTVAAKFYLASVDSIKQVLPA